MCNTDFENLKLLKIHKKVAFGGIGGQFCDGYVLGVIGIALALATAPLGLNEWMQGAIGAASLAGLFLGAIVTGVIADRIGRAPIFMITMPIFCVISVLFLFIDSVTLLIMLRFLLGLALGADYVASISLVSELTPSSHRGRLLSGMMVGWVLGYTMAFCIGFFMQNLGDDAWKYILFSSAVPSLIVAISRINTPKSPLWLIKKGRIDEAKAVVSKYFGDNVTLDIKIEEKQSGYLGLFKQGQIKNTLVGIVFYGAQVVPYFAISTFIPSVLKALNVTDEMIGGIVYNVFLLVGVVLGLLIIDRISRRNFVVWSFYILTAISLILGVWGSMPELIVIGLISIFACVLAGAGVLEFAYTPELFPTHLRASGVGLVVAASRVSGALGTFFLPVIENTFSINVALIVLALTVGIAGVFCHIFAP